MVAFHNILSTVFLASAGYGSPSTHVDRVKIDAYHPPSIFKTFGSGGIDHPLTQRSNASFGEKACSFLASEMGIDIEQVAYRVGSDGDIVSHAYLSQTHDGVPFANAVANVAMKDDKVVSYGSSFVSYSSIAHSTPSITVEDAISTAERMLGGKYNNWEPSLQYFVKEDNSSVLIHAVQIRNESANAWYNAFVDAHSGELVSVVDYVAHATYLVVPIDNQNIAMDGQVLVVDPENLSVSPLGWSDYGTGESNTTIGNNAFAFKTGTNSSRPGFEFEVNLSVDPRIGTNVDAARTNAFYVVNSMHDTTYLYGFTEAAFNFQYDNFGLGGRGLDPVRISVQDGGGFNNAFFATPPDGQSGVMTLLLFNRTNPLRDSALENDIIIHEFTHGVTNRMTGGGSAQCLQGSNEGRGLSEGWSDSLADWAASTPDNKDFFYATFILNIPAGGRSFPYSTNSSVNPLRYSDLQILNQPHAIGEVWANMLHNVLAALINDHGFSMTAKTDATGTEGNVVFLHLFLEALQLQPCNPDFLSARDAWYQADVLLYGGANRCTLQRVFASRGLGLNARDHQDDDTVDPTCM
ncbi:Fungalysin metallopeptidase-domain-containing protein [Mucidula mucida]|nr:Fungalysin metallopeptidase-domain-containing protein [Mucidula mucida]